ncbi:hypothetical protein ACLOJK_041057 [Asimina triloba]
MAASGAFLLLSRPPVHKSTMSIIRRGESISSSSITNISTAKRTRMMRSRRKTKAWQYFKVRNMAKEEEESSSSSIEIGAAVGGLVANPVIWWSLYTLKTTGCGLPPGPAGSIGALEGVSYLILIALISWSLYTKLKTGSGLPSGPYALLGAFEGISYLTFLAILLVFALQFLDRGYLPAPLPTPQCFG